MAEEIKTTQQEPTTEPKPASGQEEKKLFSQEEVEQMISERLAQNETTLGSITQKEQELNAREAQMNCREYVMEKSYPKVLLEVLDTSDAEKFKEAADKIQQAMGYTENPVRIKTGLSHAGGREVGWSDDDEIGKAFRV